MLDPRLVRIRKWLANRAPDVELEAVLLEFEYFLMAEEIRRQHD